MKGYSEYDFTADEFNGMFIPAHGLSEGIDVLAKFPQLDSPEFRKLKDQAGLSPVKLLKYIVYMYDYRSPLRDKIPDTKIRKINAMSLAGYEATNGRYPEEVNAVLMNNNRDVLGMIYRYCKLHRSSKYAYLVTLQDGVHSASLQMASGQLKELDSIKRANEEIERTLSDLLGGDNMSGVSDNFLDFVDRENLGLRPEDIAEALHEGEDPLPGVDVYGRGVDPKGKKEVLTARKEKHLQRLQEKYGA